MERHRSLSTAWYLALVGEVLPNQVPLSAYPEASYLFLKSVCDHRLTIQIRPSEKKPRWTDFVSRDLEGILKSIDPGLITTPFLTNSIVRNIIDRLGGTAKTRQAVLRKNKKESADAERALLSTYQERADRLEREARDAAAEALRASRQFELDMSSRAMSHEVQLRTLEMNRVMANDRTEKELECERRAPTLPLRYNRSEGSLLRCR